jgi:hypothetical protein
LREAQVAENRLTSSDKRELLLWVLLGIVGAVFAYKYFSAVSRGVGGF